MGRLSRKHFSAEGANPTVSRATAPDVSPNIGNKISGSICNS